MPKFSSGDRVTTTATRCLVSAMDKLYPDRVYIVLYDVEDPGSGRMAIRNEDGSLFPSDETCAMVHVSTVSPAVPTSAVFKPGDVVTLKSESYRFTVESVNDGIARVVYTRSTFADGLYVIRETFSTDLLKLAEVR